MTLLNFVALSMFVAGCASYLLWQVAYRDLGPSDE